jgi:hypothetical protein
LRSRGFFGAQCFEARSLETRSFGGERLLLRGQFCRRLSRTGRRSCLLFSRRLNVGGLSPTPDRPAVRGYWLGDRHWFRRGGRPTATCHWRGSRLLLCAIALLALPSSANAGDLVVGEHAHMAANRNVHLAEKAHHLVRGHTEFVCQFTY